MLSLLALILIKSVVVSKFFLSSRIFDDGKSSLGSEIFPSGEVPTTTLILRLSYKLDARENP